MKYPFLIISLLFYSYSFSDDKCHRPSIKLRYGGKYKLSISFSNHNEYPLGISHANATFTELHGDLDNSTNEDIFDFTDEIKDSDFVISPKKSMEIYEMKEYYNPKYIPLRRSQNAVNVKYDLEFVRKINGKWQKKKEHQLDCQSYEVTWCGDGIIDNYVDKLGGFKVREACDPKAPGWTEKKCNSSCEIIQ